MQLHPACPTEHAKIELARCFIALATKKTCGVRNMAKHLNCYGRAHVAQGQEKPPDPIVHAVAESSRALGASQVPGAVSAATLLGLTRHQQGREMACWTWARLHRGYTLVWVL